SLERARGPTIGALQLSSVLGSTWCNRRGRWSRVPTRSCWRPSAWSGTTKSSPPTARSCSWPSSLAEASVRGCASSCAATSGHRSAAGGTRPRGRRLCAALAAALVRDNAPELQLVRDWLDNWSGVGPVLVGMTHQGYDVQLTAYAARDWRTTFSHTPIVAGS